MENKCCSLFDPALAILKGRTRDWPPREMLEGSNGCNQQEKDVEEEHTESRNDVVFQSNRDLGPA